MIKVERWQLGWERARRQDVYGVSITASEHITRRRISFAGPPPASWQRLWNTGCRSRRAAGLRDARHATTGSDVIHGLRTDGGSVDTTASADGNVASRLQSRRRCYDDDDELNAADVTASLSENGSVVSRSCVNTESSQQRWRHSSTTLDRCGLHSIAALRHRNRRRHNRRLVSLHVLTWFYHSLSRES